MKRLLMIVAISVWCITSTYATKAYVNQNATGLNNGTSWENAYTTLDWALKFGYNTDTIWVAQGTYKPDDQNIFINKLETFTVSYNITLLGGFNGTETELSQRDGNVRTTLSGELGDVADTTDNATHVLTVKGKVFTIDGFIIRDGYGRSTNDNADAAGAGIYTYPYSVDTMRVSNCDFENNVTNSHCHASVREGGAAISLYEMDYVSIANSTFKNNRARNFYEYNNNASGGAIQMYNCGNVIVDSCLFENNHADNEGGAISVNYGSVIKNSTFINNSALYGGAIVSRGIIENCVMKNNSATNGGAVYSNFRSGSIINSHIEGNTAVIGGALYYSGDISNCLITKNSAATFGGGIYLAGGDIKRSIISFNSCDSGYGGGVYRMSNSIGTESSIANVTIYGNSAKIYNGLCLDQNYFNNSRMLIINNSIVWGNGDDANFLGYKHLFSSYFSEKKYFTNNNVKIENSIFEYSYVNALDSNYNIVLHQDPMFVDAEHGDFRLQANSPAIDAAIGDTLEDYFGNRAYDDSSIINHGTGTISYKDIGAVEFIGTSILSDIVLKSPKIIVSIGGSVIVTSDSLLTSGDGALSMVTGDFKGYSISKNGESYTVLSTADSSDSYKIDYTINGQKSSFLLQTDIAYVESEIVFKDRLSLDSNGVVVIGRDDYEIIKKSTNVVGSSLRFVQPQDSNYIVDYNSSASVLFDKTKNGDSLSINYYLVERSYDKGGVYNRLDTSSIQTVKIPRSVLHKKYFVDDAISGGDGSSWSSAFASPLQAFKQAVSGDTVWIKKGDYYFSTSDSLLQTDYAHYTVSGGVELYGGFSGDETDVSQRDLKNDSTKIFVQTIFNGNIYLDGVNFTSNISMKQSNTVVLKNLRIPEKYFSSYATTLKDSMFVKEIKIENSVISEGFSFSNYDIATVKNSDIKSSVYINAADSIIIDSTRFSRGSTTNISIFFKSKKATITDVSFDAVQLDVGSVDSSYIDKSQFVNWANVKSSKNIHIVNSEFINSQFPILSYGFLHLDRVKITNSSTRTVLVQSNGRALIENSIIAQNITTHEYQGLINLGDSSVIINSTIMNNRLNGGPILYTSGRAHIYNSILSNDNGYILAQKNDSLVTFTNSILSLIDTLQGTGNIEGDPKIDGKTFVPLSGSAAIDNASLSIYKTEDFYGNSVYDDATISGISAKDIGAVERTTNSTGKTIVVTTPDTLYVLGLDTTEVPLSQFSYSYSDGTSILSPTFSLGTLLYNVHVAKSNEQLYRVHAVTDGDDSSYVSVTIGDGLQNSQAIVIPVKMSKTFNPYDFIKDTLYVDVSKSGNGTSWDSAFASIQEAIDNSKIGDEIWIAKGIYTAGKDAILKDSIKIYGGFEATEASIEQREKNSFSTVEGSSGYYNYHLFVAGNANVIDGFRFVNGFTNKNYASYEKNDHGGAIVGDSIHGITITNSIFEGNSSKSYGAAVYISNSKNIIVENCHFSKNYCTSITSNPIGAIALEKTENSSITNCTFENNNSGGVYYRDAVQNYVGNCSFTKNRAAVYGISAGATVENSLFVANIKDWGGAGVYIMLTPLDPLAKVVNCTFYDNVALYNGVYPKANYASVDFGNTTAGKMEVINNIFWRSDSIDTDNKDVRDVVFKGELILHHNTIYGDTLMGNFVNDPLFVDAENGDFTLNDSSKCINAGDSITLTSDKDLAGEARVFAKIDLGAYENQYVDSIPLDTNKTGESIYFSPFDTDGNSVRIGPNPITEDSKIFVQCDDREKAVVKIYNENAMVVYSQKASIAEEMHGRASLQRLPGTFIQNMKNGIYWIVLEKDGEIVSVSKAYKK